MYRQSGVFVETTEGSKWIFVLSTSRNLYVGQKKKGVFQHSSFLSGGATMAAGRLVAHGGVLEVHIYLLIIILQYACTQFKKNIPVTEYTTTVCDSKHIYLCCYTFYRLYGLTVATTTQQKRTSGNSLASLRSTM